MVQPASIVNSTGQKLDIIIDPDGTRHLKLSVGVKAVAGVDDDAAWQGIATHVDGAEFVASDGLVALGGVDRTGTDTVRPIIVDSSGRPYVRSVALAGALADGSGVLAAAATAEDALAANVSRVYLLIQNVDPTEDLWIDFGQTAVMAQPSFVIPAGGGFEPRYVPTGRISVIAATINHPYSVREA